MRALSVSTGKRRLQSALEASGFYAIHSRPLAILLDGIGLLHTPGGDALLVAGPTAGYDTNNWSGFTVDHWWRTRHPDFAAFEVHAR